MQGHRGMQYSTRSCKRNSTGTCKQSCSTLPYAHTIWLLTLVSVTLGARGPYSQSSGPRCSKRPPACSSGLGQGPRRSEAESCQIHTMFVSLHSALCRLYSELEAERQFFVCPVIFGRQVHIWCDALCSSAQARAWLALSRLAGCRFGH